MEEKCITCGSPVKIVGHTTMSYEPLYPKLQSALKEAREALEFYGNGKNWEGAILLGNLNDFGDEYLQDEIHPGDRWKPSGKRARAALKRIDEILEGK